MENNNQPSIDKSKLRDFPLSTWSVKNTTTVFLLAIVILIFGVQTYQNIAKEQFPEVEFPTVFINTPYFGNSASDIENLVTRPIEKELQGVQGVKNISSTSIQDFSVITVEFEADENLDEALRRVKDAVDKSKSELPNDLDQEPTVLDINLSELPIVTINISGDYPVDQLRKYAEFLQDRIEEIDEVSEAQLKGALEREVKIDLNPLKMSSYEIGFGDVENAISAENLTLSAGEIINDGFRRAIRVTGEFKKVSDLENLIVKSENQRPIYLRDIGTVTFGYKERTSIARSDQLPVISLDIIKRKGKNLLFAADKIYAKIEEAKPLLPSDLKISLFNDQSVNTRDQVSNLENSIISGVILVVLVLLFFLGLRNSLFVGLAIPLSMLMGFIILGATGVSINIVVLFGLILALGMLVDNGIVVVENIYRYMQEGFSAQEAARYGAGEVAVAVITSTATTLAAFLPLAFWPGLIGEFMYYLPFTLIIVLSSSLFVALAINPAVTARFMTLNERADDIAVRNKRRRNALILGVSTLLLAVIFHFVDVNTATSYLWARNIFLTIGAVTLVNFFLLRPASFFFQNRILPVLENGYDVFVRAALRVPIMIVITSFLLLGFSFYLISLNPPKVELFPSSDPLYVNAFVELPLGTSIESTDETINILEQKIQTVVEPYGTVVEAVLTQIGENTSDPNSPPEPGASPNKARVTVQFVPSQDRDGVSTVEIMNKIRTALQGYPGLQIVVDQNANGPPTGKPINLEIRGDDIVELINSSQNVINYFNNLKIPGIEELKSDVQVGKPELIINVDREAARRYGLSTGQIASAIRTSVFGKEVSKYKDGEDEYPIFVRLDEKYRNNVGDILNQQLIFRDNTGKLLQIPIAAVASADYTSTYSAIKRKNLKRVITIYSNVVGGYNANEIVGELKNAMDKYQLPNGFSYEFTGEQEQQAETSAFLSNALLITVFLILMILVTQFNSFSVPFIILLTVLFSTIGVLLGYAIFGGTVSIVFTGVGIISLAGVVVNNAIVLLDYTNLLLGKTVEEVGVNDEMELSRDQVREAVIKAGSTRLRPVLLTAITTILGLVPLALGFNFNFFTLISESDPKIFYGGDNADFWGPMAWTVIYGLTFATFLTLIVVPAMYWLFYRLRTLTSKTYKVQRQKEALAQN